MNQPANSQFTEAQFNEIAALLDLRVAAAVAEFYAAQKSGGGTPPTPPAAARAYAEAEPHRVPEYVRYRGHEPMAVEPTTAAPINIKLKHWGETQAEAEALDAGVT